MKYLKQMCRLLVVMLVIVAFSLVSVVSPAHAETLSAPDQAAADSNLKSLEAQAAAAGIGVRIVNGVKVFRTKDGQDLKMVTCCDGSDAVVFGDDLRAPENLLAAQLAPQDIVGSGQQIVSPQSIVTILNPACYSQKDTQWRYDYVGKSTTDQMYNQGCYVTSAAMEAATYNIYISGSLATPSTTNTWLKNNGGFATGSSSLVFDAMANMAAVGGTWYSVDHQQGLAYYYQQARAFIVGTGTGTACSKPSLPIMRMSGPVPMHNCAWYGSDGTTNPANNDIIQPTLSATSSFAALHCTAVSGAANGNYTPYTTPDLMRVAWHK
jgi:hypothetical protein